MINPLPYLLPWNWPLALAVSPVGAVIIGVGAGFVPPAIAATALARMGESPGAHVHREFEARAAEIIANARRRMGLPPRARR